MMEWALASRVCRCGGVLVLTWVVRPQRVPGGRAGRRRTDRAAESGLGLTRCGAPRWRRVFAAGSDGTRGETAARGAGIFRRVMDGRPAGGLFAVAPACQKLALCARLASSLAQGCAACELVYSSPNLLLLPEKRRQPGHYRVSVRRSLATGTLFFLP